MERLQLELARPLADGYYALLIIDCHDSEYSAFVGSEDAETMRRILKERRFVAAGIKGDEECFVVARKLGSGGVIVMLSMYDAHSNTPAEAFAYFLTNVDRSEAPQAMAVLHYSYFEFLLH